MTNAENFFLNKNKEYMGHEAVMAINDSSGLRGFIVIHNTNLGPAVGGTRFRYYKNEKEALKDALRLSRAMTYKCAMAGVPFGGGKTVIMSPKGMTQSQKNKYLIAYARRLKLLDGHFFTGEDVGLDGKDISLLEKHSDSIVGRPKIGGLPAQWAALSVSLSMEAALKSVFGTESFKGRTVAIKGLGNVGLELCRIVIEKGGEVVAADIRQERTKLAHKRFPKIRIVGHTNIHKQQVDVYAPCALGDELNVKTITELQCLVVCGAANNQLGEDQDGLRLFKRNILYVPDYVANAGGLINVVDELHSGGYSHKHVARHVQQIKKTVQEIIKQSRKQNKPTNEIADSIAEKRFYKSKSVQQK